MNKSNLTGSSLRQIDSRKLQPIKLPQIDKPKNIKYQNDYQNFQDQFNHYKQRSSLFNKQKQIQQKIDLLSDSQESISSIQSIKENKIDLKKDQVIVQTGNHIINEFTYTDKSSEQIQAQIKKMRIQILQINDKLNQKLNTYNLAKDQFIPKKGYQDFKPQYYLLQIYTNKKVQQAQIQQLKKLNSKQSQIKDKDLLIDLQELIQQLKIQIHSKQKQDHDQKLKVYKTNKKLTSIIKTNNQNYADNQVKILKLQIIYYLKKQNHLKIHQEQLDHELKLIDQNDKNLDKKIQKFKQLQFYKFVDQNYENMKSKYLSLIEKKQNIIKTKSTIKKSNLINQQKKARQLLKIINQIDKVIKPKIIQYTNKNQILCQKIDNLLKKHRINQNILKSSRIHSIQDILQQQTVKDQAKSNYKPKFILNNQKISNYQQNNDKNLINLLPRFKKSQSLSEQKQTQNVKNTQKYYSNKKINRYNDKNITIDVINDQQNTTKNSLNLVPFKNKRFRNVQQKTNRLILSNSKTIEIEDQKYLAKIPSRLLKPTLLKISKSNKN